MRAFFALDLEASTVDRLVQAAGSLRQDSARLPRQLVDGRWVPGTRMHVTLKFLGEVADERRDELAAWCGEVARDRRAPRLGDGLLGGFPSPAGAHVLVYLLDDPDRELANVAAEIERRGEASGFERERRSYRPHVTLARTRGAADVRRLCADLPALALADARATHVTLYRSDRLRPDDPYVALARRAFI
jgi:2'-5' RNA ligase